MAWNGSGVFSRIHNWSADALAGIKILASRHDAEDDNFATAINNCLTKDGQNSATDDLPMGGNKHTDVGNASARDEYPSTGQVQDGAFVYAVDTGSADAYAISLSPAVTAYAAGQRFAFKAANASTGASTLAVNGLAVKTIKKNGNDDLAANDIKTDQIVEVEYDGTNFQMLSQLGNAPTSGISDVVDDTSPQLGGDLDLNGNAIDFPSTANISDVLDEDNMASDSAAALATQQSIKKYVDDNAGDSITIDTENTDTSVTSIPYTTIPAGASRVTGSIKGLSTNGSSNLVMTLGDSGGLETSGYSGHLYRGSSAKASATDEFTLFGNVNAGELYEVFFDMIHLGSNKWSILVISNSDSGANSSDFQMGVMHKTLSSELTQLSITTSNGTDQFDVNGGVNIQSI